MSRSVAIGMTVIGLMFAWGIDAVTAASTSQLRSARAFKEAQLHRDLGTVRFGRRRPWAFRYRGFRRAYRAAVNRLPLERRQRHRLLLRLKAASRPLLQRGGGGWLITYYCLRGRTATGTYVHPGTVAVDPRIIPLGSRVYVAGYGWGTAEDTGGAIVGHHVDVWVGSCSLAMRSTHYGTVTY